MHSKQKSLNPLGDIKSMGRRISAADLRQLQKQRFLKIVTREREEVESEEHEEEKTLPPVLQDETGEDETGAVIQATMTVPESREVPDSILARRTPRFPKVLSFFKPQTHRRQFRQKRFPSPVINLLPAGYRRRFWPRFYLAKSSLPVVAGYLALSFLFLSVFPLIGNFEKARSVKKQVLGAVSGAYGDLQAAKDSIVAADFQNADKNLTLAFSGFSRALEELKSLNAALESLPAAKDARDLIVAAQEATLGLKHLNAGMDLWLSIRFGETGVQPPGGDDAKAILQAGFENFAVAKNYLAGAVEIFSSIKLDSFPDDVKSKISSASSLIAHLRLGVEDFDRLQSLPALFFQDQPKTYLLLFQNNRELRPTGGFIGTYGLATFQSGKLLNLKIETVYNPDGQLKALISPPGPLQRFLTSRWAMRDSNWFFSFPDSAGKAADFLKLETGVAADGVIAVTPRLFENLLRLTGPISMPAYGVVLTADNFVDQVQYQTSVVYDRRLNQPKKFLSDFAPILLQRVSQLDAGGWLSSLQFVLAALDEKDLMIHVADGVTSAQLESLNWSGSVRSSAGDYLAIVNSNVGAGKTDQDISQDVRLEAELTPAGEQINTLLIKRRHNPGLEKDFPTNADFMRVYVPAGSVLVSAAGFDDIPFYPSAIPGQAVDPDLEKWDNGITLKPNEFVQILQESGKTVFAGWIVLPPGQEREIKLVYRVFTRHQEGQFGYYSLLAQKQPGASPTVLETALTVPSGKEVVWSNPGDLSQAAGRFIFRSSFEKDVSWGLIFK